MSGSLVPVGAAAGGGFSATGIALWLLRSALTTDGPQPLSLPVPAPLAAVLDLPTCPVCEDHYVVPWQLVVAFSLGLLFGPCCDIVTIARLLWWRLVLCLSRLAKPAEPAPAEYAVLPAARPAYLRTATPLALGDGR